MVVFKSNFSYDYVVYQRGFQAVVTAGTSQLNTHLSTAQSAPPATHGNTVQSMSCELHDCSEHAQTSNFLSICREGNPMHTNRSGRDTDETVFLAFTKRLYKLDDAVKRRCQQES